ncbi:MAG: ferrochelatase [Sulfurovaceae bacterium]
MKKAIVLLNMGGPNNLDEVKLFLTNMFNDARIIAAPKPLRWLIAKIITTKRAEAAKENYRLLGGKSPIMKYTNALVKKLEAKVDARVSPLMRYTPPFAKEVLESLQDMDAIYAIPLYPQYSATTTASSFDDLFKNAKSLGISDKIKTIEHYPTHPLYIASICKRIQEALGKDKAEDFELIFSAHGLPQKMIDRGDPYQKEIKNTLFMARKALIEAELSWTHEMDRALYG